MKDCPNCHEEVEENFELCWNCNYSFADNEVVMFEDAELNLSNERNIKCLRCPNEKMKFAGTYNFHEGTNFGVLGNLLELFNNKESFELYICPNCGKVEFFTPQ